jgi:hypothetical protein
MNLKKLTVLSLILACSGFLLGSICIKRLAQSEFQQLETGPKDPSGISVGKSTSPKNVETFTQTLAKIDINTLDLSVLRFRNTLNDISGDAALKLLTSISDPLKRQLFIAALAYTHPEEALALWPKEPAEVRQLIALGLAQSSPALLGTKFNDATWNSKWDVLMLAPLIFSGGRDLAIRIVQDSKSLKQNFPDSVWQDLALIAPQMVLDEISNKKLKPINPQGAWAAITMRYVNERSGSQVAELLGTLNSEQIITLSQNLGERPIIVKSIEDALTLGEKSSQDLISQGLSKFAGRKISEEILTADSLDGFPVEKWKLLSNENVAYLADLLPANSPSLTKMLYSEELDVQKKSVLAASLVTHGMALPDDLPSSIQYLLAARFPDKISTSLPSISLDSAFKEPEDILKLGVAPAQALAMVMLDSTKVTDPVSWITMLATAWRDRDPISLKSYAENLPSSQRSQILSAFMRAERK